MAATHLRLSRRRSVSTLLMSHRVHKVNFASRVGDPQLINVIDRYSLRMSRRMGPSISAIDLEKINYSSVSNVFRDSITAGAIISDSTPYFSLCPPELPSFAYYRSEHVSLQQEHYRFQEHRFGTAVDFGLLNLITQFLTSMTGSWDTGQDGGIALDKQDKECEVLK